MSTKKQLPKVVIVGRMNVGKSTLFNRLSEKVKSIILDYEGVTRDLLSDTVHWQDRAFELVDTGGISLRKTQDPIAAAARQKVLDALQDADLVLFVCDGTIGLVQEDREIGKLLHKTGTPVALIANKADSKIIHEHMHEFDRMGFKPIIPLSAQHGTGIDDLLEYIVAQLPEQKIEHEKETLQPKVVVLGKPNVGKSSLINLLLGEDKVLVADMPGTTREAISENIRFYSEDILITDTPGIRRKKGVTEELEQLMVKSSFRALDKANIVLLMVDASEKHIADQELKLAFYAFQEKHRALIILFNKQDLMDEHAKERLEFDLARYKHLLKKVETLNISCKDGKNVGRILPLVQKVWARHIQEFDGKDLHLLFLEALRRTPLYKNEQQLMVFGVDYIKASPITIKMRVNHPRWFGPSQLAFFEGVMRKNFDLKGVPIQFVVTRR